MPKTENSFEKKFFIFLIIILFLIGIVIFSVGIIFNENYFLKFSPDKALKDATLKSVHKLQLILVSVSTLFFVMVLLFLKNQKRLSFWIGKHKRALQNTSLLLGIIILLFIVSEVSLRIAYNETTFAGGYGPGSLKFNKRYVTLNDDGMRDRNFSVEKPANTVRIASIGDSFAFGSGIKNANDTYSKALERKLNSLGSNKTYEVLNFGIMGLSTDDEVSLIENKALKYSPDIILLGYVSNDFVNVEPIKYKEHWTILPGGLWIRNFLFTYAVIELKLNRVFENIGIKKTGLEISLIKLNSTKNIEYNKALFKELNKTASANNIKVLVVNFPAIYNLNNYPLQKLNDFVNETSAEIGSYYFDLTEVYKEYPESDLVVNNYDSHPNELGHEIAADYILEKLKNAGLV